jgi:hypothetical protein
MLRWAKLASVKEPGMGRLTYHAHIGKYGKDIAPTYFAESGPTLVQTPR